MLLIFIYVALLSYNVEYLTLPMANLECMVDEAGSVAILDEHGRLVKGGSKRFVQDMQTKRKREDEREARQGGSWSKSKHRTAKAKKQKDKERENNWYGYLGEHRNGMPELKWSHIWSEGTDAVMDIPLGGVCEVLYGEGNDVI